MSQSTESNPLRTASAPPDAPAPSATLASEAAPLDAPQRPAEAAPKVDSKFVVGAQPRTPNLDRIAKLSRRLAVNVTVAKTTAPGPRARAEMLRQPQHPGASTIQQAPTEPHTIAVPASAHEPVNPTTHVFGAQTGVLDRSAVDQTATKSGDWAIQFAEPKSEVEAKVAAARLNAKYAPALNGATIDVRKTQVNGATIYALHTSPAFPRLMRWACACVSRVATVLLSNESGVPRRFIGPISNGMSGRRPVVKGLVEALRTLRVRSCLRPLLARVTNVPLALMLVRMALRPISKTRSLWRLPFSSGLLSRSVGSHRFAVALDADRLAAKTRSC